jgi:ribosomal protein L14E/L6E/L27E
MVGVITKGQLTGKMCVIQHRMDQGGMVQVCLRRSDGTSERNTFAVHYDELVLAEPGKRETAMVVAGRHKGRQGVVKVRLIYISLSFIAC